MKGKWLPFLLLAVLLGAAIAIKQCARIGQPQPRTVRTDQRGGGREPAANPDRNRGLDRRVSFLEYTRHARCRMACRHITQAEVEQILREGTINYRKSDVNAHPCPTYAVEGYSSDNQHLRIVFAQCDYTTKVVTCIDLGHEWACHCPGDDEHYKNQRE
ncbi:MAG TPA: DUF4258 domain-containing protein [Chitinophagaceae bacterium]|nr:DUF4258 domain-containing protein [Chitinophagaceae bacterium]